MNHCGTTHMSSAQRAERRKIAWALHPDRGGDPAAFIAAMAAPAAATALQPPTHGIRIHGIVARSCRRIAQAEHMMRTRLPRRWPGARRYAQL